MPTATIGKIEQKQRVEVSTESVSARYSAEHARSLGRKQADITETIKDLQTLKDAKGNYRLAVGSKGLLGQRAGWNQVIREGDKVIYKPIPESAANELIDANRWDEIIYITQQALGAAKEGRPITLNVFFNSVRYSRFLDVDVWPCGGARVALKPKLAAKPGPSQANLARQMEALLREVSEAEKANSEMARQLRALRKIARIAGKMKADLG